MKQFYVGLAAGNDEATVLQQAKTSALRRLGANASPYYWANFTLVGEGSRPIIVPIRTSAIR